MFAEKIFVLGFNKTATASIHFFLKNNEISSAHWLDRRDDNKKNLAVVMEENLKSKLPILTGIDGFVAYSDLSYVSNDRVIEANKFYAQIYAEYPNAIYLLNTRPLDDWLLSRLRHKDLTERYSRATNLGLRELLDYWAKEREELEREIRQFFGDNPNFCNFDISMGFEPMFDIFRRRGVPITNWKMPHRHLGITKANLSQEKEAKKRKNKLRRRLRRLKRLIKR